MNLRELYLNCKTKLENAGVDTPEIEARLILIQALKLSREDIVFKGEVDISEGDVHCVDDIVAQRLLGVPLSKIFGEKEFWSLSFKVTKDTLDPRPDSETLIEAILDYKKSKNEQMRILDIGTGTGCLVISALSEYPNAMGVAIDISDRALAVAKENRDAHGMEDRLQLLNIGWSELPHDECYDVVISNPPYIDEADKPDLQTEVVDHDPHIALFADGNGLDAYREIAKFLKEILKPETGMGVFEIGFNQAADVSEIFRKNDLEVLEVRKDLSGHDRCIIVKTA
jgi:release factor glutamine methyltransferase